MIERNKSDVEKHTYGRERLAYGIDPRIESVRVYCGGIIEYVVCYRENPEKYQRPS